METQRLRRLVRPTSPEAQLVPQQSTDRSQIVTTPALNAVPAANTSGWISFTYAQFGAAVFMTGLGIWAMPVELMVKGYMMMSAVFLIGSTFTLAKTVRDEHEAKRLASRIEEARTEKLLMEVGRGG